MITYENDLTLSHVHRLIVRLDGKITGHIVALSQGFVYRPIGAKHRHIGEIFPSLYAVKKSLEG